MSKVLDVVVLATGAVAIVAVGHFVAGLIIGAMFAL